MRFRLLVALIVLSFCQGRCYGQAFIEGVFPPSLKRGETTRIELSGTDLETAHQLWTSLPTKLVSTERISVDSRGQVFADIQVANDAPLGLYGLRLATNDGLSNPHLFAIDDLPTTKEQELGKEETNNNMFDRAQLIELPSCLVGVCRPADVDHFCFDVVADELLSFEVVGSRLGKGFDPLITILDEKQRYLTDRDNDVGLFFDSRFQFRFKKAGRYTVRLHDARYQGSDHWSYMLRIGRFPVARVAIPSTIPAGENVTVLFPQLASTTTTVQLADTTRGTFFFDFRRPGDQGSTWLPLTVSSLPNHLEKEPNDEQPEATAVTVPGNLHGVLAKENDWDWYSFDLKKGTAISLRVETRTIGSPADVELSLYDATGKLLKQVDDVGFDDARFDFTAPEDGCYRLAVHDVVQHGGPAFAYRVEINESAPLLQLQSEIGRMAIPQGNWQPLPLAIGRTRFDAPVQLVLDGAPDGITLEVNEVGAGVTSFVARLQVDDDVPAGLYTLQVVGTSTVNDQLQLSAIATTRPLIDKLPTGRGPHGEPFELREDQRRLPQTLTDRIAVLVTPPSPYDFQLTSPLVILPRYLSTQFQFNVTTDGEFKENITFVARGGELEWDNLREPRVVTSIPEVAGAQDGVTAVFSSKVNTAILTQRVTVTSTARLDNRLIHLTRTFDLTIQEAFKPTGAEESYQAEPGELLTVRIEANRLPPYAGLVRVAPQQVAGIPLPASIEIPADQTGVEVKIQVAADAKPGSHAIKLEGSGRVAKFDEQASGTITIVIKPAESDENK
jgi:hypothetical protein